MVTPQALPDNSQIMALLEEVKDPEIPVLSLIDLGVITGIHLNDTEDKIVVEMTPTFSGCPAINYMQKDVERVLAEHNIPAEVRVSFENSWNSNRITEKGRLAIKKFGLAPPPRYEGKPNLELLLHAECPFCDSSNTEPRNPFGPTLCRAFYYCNNCSQLFEQFKPV
jgi:ring-1,2-phenylacetyl-CoA epoxidase subunit PaaD